MELDTQLVFVFVVFWSWCQPDSVCRVQQTTHTPQKEYARLVLHHRTEGAYGRAAAAMRRGLCEVLQDPRGKLLRVYTAPELGALVGGIDAVDAGEWEAHTAYDGAWRACVAWRARFLLFVCMHRNIGRHPSIHRCVSYS